MELSAPLTDKANALEALADCQRVYNEATISSDDFNVLIQETENCIKLDFRGSKSPQDWVNNFDLELITVSGGKVHQGIWISYQNKSSELRSRLKKMSRKPLVGAAHSRGWGHCGFAMFDLFGEYDVDLVMSFGGMRWCDPALATSYNAFLADRTIRYVNSGDPVPHVPFHNLDYAHVGHEAFLPDFGGVVFDATGWTVAKSDIETLAKEVEAGKPDVFANHHLSTYQARLDKL